jgi:uncharacterized membrane protein
MLLKLAIRMTARTITGTALHVAATAAALAAFASAARADFQLCSRMSYVVEAAIAVEDKGAAASRGWFRIDPGRCRKLLQGALPAGSLYLHARALAIYGDSPLPQRGDAEFCIMTDNFLLANARHCSRKGQTLARFTAIKPAESEQGPTAYLAEDAEYNDEQARDAAIQRLLVIAGYDASPIDGVRGEKTEAALALFIADNKLTATAAGRSDFFDTLIAAAQKPNADGFAWCNDTRHVVMAAIGFEDHGAVTTRGWYSVAPGKCLRPDLDGKPRRLYSFGEAVGPDGLAIKTPSQPTQTLSWGGSTILCTREAKFEISDQQDCAAMGLNPTGFASVELFGRHAATVRFK